MNNTLTENKAKISQDIDLYLKENDINPDNRNLRRYIIGSVVSYAALVLALVTMIAMYIEESRALTFITDFLKQGSYTEFYFAESSMPNTKLIILFVLLVIAVISIFGLFIMRKHLIVKYISTDSKE